MPAGNSHANPPPPIRTDTSSSAAPNYLQTPKSAITSPTTPHSSTSAKSPSTPGERSFFGALAQNIRERSRSRSRARNQAQQTQSTPSSQLNSPTSAVTPTSPAMSPRYSRPQSMRHVSELSTTSTRSTASTAKRTSTASSEVSFEKFSYGRHSNDWLFNGFSVKDTASKLFGRGHNGEDPSSP